jgi:hypothetical protein
MSTLSTIVMEGLAAAPASSGTTQITIGNDHVDEQFQSFLADIYRRHHRIGITVLTENGALLAAFRSLVAKMLQYMEEIYDLLDEPLLDDFKKSLFKAFAWVCGVQLAAAIDRGSRATREMLHDVCADLKDSI